ncbi:MAG: hypothetical protein AAF715_30485 [Myxococcota bacterium]
MAPVGALDELVAAHPVALSDLFGAGPPVDATRLGGRWAARLLALTPLEPVFLLTRPLVRGASIAFRGAGKHFESGGTGGRDLVWGRATFRFRCEVAPSRVDGAPSLRLSYDGLGNPGVVAPRIDELRRVGPTVALGATWLRSGGTTRPAYWWGLDAIPTPADGEDDDGPGIT